MRSSRSLWCSASFGLLAALAVFAAATRGVQPGAPERVPFLFPDGIVFDAVFSKDGTLLAIACEDKAVRIYDWKTGKLVSTLRGHNERVWSIAFAPDGKSLASCTGEYREPNNPGEIKLWNLATGNEIATLKGHRGLIFCVAYGPDGKTLYSGSWDGTIKVWDLATREEKAALLGHTGPVRRVGFTPDKKRLVTVDGTVRFWDPDTHKEQDKILAHNGGAQAAVFTPDGKLLVTCSRPATGADPGNVKVWHVETGKEKMTLTGPTRWILSLAVSPDGNFVAAAGGYQDKLGEVKIFHLASGKELATLLGGHKEWVECVAFSPDGQWLVSGGGFTRGAKGEIRIWELARLLGKK
jgi:WD40 repeat protein